jgi:hypothetical protein
MRKWPVLLIVGMAVGSLLVSNAASVIALGEIAGRPILALASDAGSQRVPVQSPGQPAGPGEARILGGEGVLFGHAFRFGMPDSSTVTCTIRFRSLGCDRGWTAERASAD